MASTYTPTELAGSGSLLKENFESNSTFELTITNKSLTSSGYLVMETNHPTATVLPTYFEGSDWSGSYAVGAVYNAYTQGIVIDPAGSTTILWTPAIDVIGDNVYLKAVGNFGVTIDGVEASSPIFYYDPATSYSGTGTVLTDLSGNNRNATIAGSPPYTSGVGGYFTFSNDYIRTVNLSSLVTTGDEAHSVEVWIYPTNNGVIASYLGSTTIDDNYHFSAIELVSGQVEFGLWAPTIVSTGGTGALAFNQWHQVVLTYNGHGSPVKGYVDGALAGQTANMNWDSPMDGGDPFYIAFGALDSTDQGNGTYFDGRMGVIRMYDKQLSAGEVLQNYNVTKGQYGL